MKTQSKKRQPRKSPRRQSITARAVEPNAGRRIAFSRALHRFFVSYNETIYNEFIDELEKSPLLAYDALIRSTPRTDDLDPLGIKGSNTQIRLSRLKAKLDSAMRRNPSSLVEAINTIIATRMVGWLASAEREIRALLTDYVRKCALDISSAMRRALVSAGVKPEVFQILWRRPTLTQYISPNALGQIPVLIDTQTALITRMAASDLARLRDVLTQCITQGRDFADVEAALLASQGFDPDRAKRVALDQTIKISQAVQLANAQSLGITRGVWIHVPGQYSSRETHIEFNGQEFDLDRGLFDEQVAREVVPGELPYCRCLWRSVVPNRYLGIDLFADESTNADKTLSLVR